MTDCKWAGTDRPRVLGGRHLDECEGGECRGCVPCPAEHCRVDHTIHVETAHDTCPACREEARSDLAEIQRMCRALPEEVEHRGVNGEAMNLLGPVADPEAWGHRQASAAVGRIDRAWLEEATDARHPLLVLGTWLMVWQDALEHEDTSLVTVDSAARYLDTQLTYMAGFEDVPFEDFARDLRACVAHMELVLHDGEQVDRGVPCMRCAVPLQRVYGITAAGDGWRCPKCRQVSTDAQYRFAVKADYIERAEWLTDVDMTVRTGVKAGTVRSWARDRGNEGPPLVRKKRHEERTVYLVGDVLAVAKDKGLAA